MNFWLGFLFGAGSFSLIAWLESGKSPLVMLMGLCEFVALMAFCIVAGLYDWFIERAWRRGE